MPESAPHQLTRHRTGTGTEVKHGQRRPGQQVTHLGDHLRVTKEVLTQFASVGPARM